MLAEMLAHLRIGIRSRRGASRDWTSRREHATTCKAVVVRLRRRGYFVVRRVRVADRRSPLARRPADLTTKPAQFLQECVEFGVINVRNVRLTATRLDVAIGRVLDAKEVV